MGKYEPLAQFLASRNEDTWTATFDEVAAKLGFALPKSAREYRAWWSNQEGPGHSQKEGWQSAGWETRDVDMRRGLVRFERVGRRRKAGSESLGRAADAELDALWRRAGVLSGIRDRAQLEREVLTQFIQREAGRKLVAMGGTMPNFVPAPRERPFA